MFKGLIASVILLLIFSGQVAALHDPMRPAYETQGLLQPGQTQLDRSLRLSSLVVRPTQRYAVLNGIRMKEGDTIGETEIVRIFSNHILVRKNGLTTKLYLSVPISKQGDKNAKH